MKIFCIGRNYDEHARELNNPIPERPVIFMKPQTALSTGGAAFVLPDFSDDVHYEAELVLRLGRGARAISDSEALDIIDAVTVGIDFTARDLQAELKKKGHPWEIAKGFDGSAAVGRFIPWTDAMATGGLGLRLALNGTRVQQGHSEQMRFPIERLIAYLSNFFTLEPGDLIFTGTPAGVGPVSRGDRFDGSLRTGPPETPGSEALASGADSWETLLAFSVV